MNNYTRWTICTCTAAAILSAPLLVPPKLPFAAAPAHAQSMSKPKTHRGAARAAKPQTPPPAPTTSNEPPPRVPYTAADAAAAVIPGIPEARFWASSLTDFTNALPSQPGPWLVLSSGGEDGAFGAGLLTGLTAAGKRPDYAVVTGVSTGALMAPFIFAGPKYDDALRLAYTNITSADIYEAGRTSEAFADSWPLRDLIAKQVTPQLFADVADGYRKGRRLFVVSYDLDAERSVIWNMGAIAAHGGDDALKLFRTVLLASASIPGAFPPTLIDVEANGKKFQEMHADGGIGGQFFVAPAALMASTSDYRLPAAGLYIVINTSLEPEFQVVERFVPSILTQAVGAAVKVDTRLMLDRAYDVAKRSGLGFNAATVPASFHMPSRGAFDPDYMKALFNVGFEQGKGDNPFANEPPPYSGRLQTESTDPKPTEPQPGANK
jgi:predicted acylesterase/phospholipase RssA